MARKIIDIGIVGNDGTGDSIRDSFRKVNDNFRELYSSLGLGERLTFVGLSDVDRDNYDGLVLPDDATKNTPILTVNNTGTGVMFKRLVEGNGVTIDFISNDQEIVINSDFSEISADDSPQLGGPLFTYSGGIRHAVGGLPDLTDTGEFQSAISEISGAFGTDNGAGDPDRMAVNKAYADSKVALAGVNAINPATGNPESAYGRMTGPLILSRNPEPDDDTLYNGLIAATKSYVDSSAFGSSVNLYVALSGQDDRIGVSRTLQGRALAYAYRTLEAALKRAEELVNEAREEIGPYKKVLTYNDGAGECYLAAEPTASPLSGSGFEGDIRMSVDTITLTSVGTNYFPGDILTVNGGTISPGGGACTIEVLSTLTTPGAISTYRIISTGSYSALPGSTGLTTTITTAGGPEEIGAIGAGAVFSATYKVNSVSIIDGGSGYSLVSVRIIGGGGSGAFGTAVVEGGEIISISITDKGTGFTSKPILDVSLPRFLIYTAGYGTDFTGDVTTETPEAVRGRDIREGLYLRGETSGALAQILSHSGTLEGDNEIFDVDIKYGRFEVGEKISYGDITKNIQISVLVESGEYHENYPLKVPTNVSIVGDEFRRVIFKPKPGVSSSPWAFQKFRRDKVIDGLTVTTSTSEFGYHYLTDPDIPVYPKIDNKGDFKSSATLLDLNRTFLQDEIIAWLDYNINANLGTPFNNTFNYNKALYKKDVGLLVDAFVFDLKYGRYNRTISAALKYYENSVIRSDVEEHLPEYLALLTHLEELMLAIIANDEITDVKQTFYPQIIDPAYQAEPGSSDVVTSLIQAVKDIIDESGPGFGSVNQPLDNREMDVFLANDAVRWQAISAIGHGGFMGVLDPEGQILSRSPYFQECASFSRSKDRQVFAGGMFVDGFAGNLEFNIDEVVTPTRLRVSDLERFPQLPCSFIVADSVYRVNYIRDFAYDKDGSTATFILDETTPWPYDVFVYDSAACFRDVGLIIDGLTYDILFSTNYWTRQNGLTYRLSNASKVVDEQRIITLEAISLAHELVKNEIPGFTEVRTAVDLSNSTIADILDRGTAAAPTLTFTLPTGISTNTTNAYNLLMSNRDYIVAEVQGWIQAQIASNLSPWATGDTYNESKSQRDTKLVIEAVIHDLIYGGNIASRHAALKYYNNLTGASMLAAGQPARCAAAINYAKYLASQVILNLAPTVSYSALIRQTGAPASSSEVDVVEDRMNEVSSAILANNINSVAAAIPPGTTGYPSSLSTARTLILAAKTEIQTSVVDYVDFNGNRYELLMPGNRSMLANDYTQINDMGYGAIAANGGLMELVSVFTYYCYTSYYSLRGGQIRSVGGSSSHGVYALVAEGADPLEVPTPTTIYEELAQRVVCYFPSPTYSNDVGSLLIYVTGYDYTPLGGSELEVDHGGIIYRYPVTSVTTSDLPAGVARLNLSTTEGAASEGLFALIPDGTKMTLRSNGQVLLTGGLEDVAVRPSTGLKLRETTENVYRVLQFTSDVDQNGPYEVLVTPGNPGIFKVLATVTDIDLNVCTTSGNHKLKVGDKFIPTSTEKGFVSGTTYYVIEVPNYNQFMVSTAPNGASASLTNGTGLSIKGVKTHKILENYTINFSTTGTLPAPLVAGTMYYVLASDLTDTEFAIATQKNGTAIEVTSAGTGIQKYNIAGLTLTQLRENYNYIDLTVWQPGEFVTSGTTCTISIGSPTDISLAGHTFVAGDVVKFETSGDLPTGISELYRYFVVTDGLVPGVSFRVSLEPEGTPADTTGTQSGTHTVGLVTGRAGDTSFAVVGVGSNEISRVSGSKFVFLGEEYTISSYQPESITGGPYARVVLDRPLVNSIINYASSYTIKSAVPIRSSGSLGTLTIRISLTRCTSHDLLEIGTGSYADTNYPKEIYGGSVNPLDPSLETEERDVGRCFYVTTDQYGNFNVGPYFRVDQGTGQVTFSSSIALSNLDGIGFKRGVPVSEFSTDSGFVDNATDTVPTENAIRTYIDRRLGVSHNGATVVPELLIPSITGGYLSLDGQLSMKGNIDLDQNSVINIADPISSQDAVNLRSLNWNNFQNTEITNPDAGDVLVFTGNEGDALNATVTGDITFELRPGTDSSLNQLNAQITAGTIVNTDINSGAAIEQSKLAMNAATSRANSTGITQADRGLASFNSSDFTVTDGWVSLKSNSIDLTDLAQTGSRTVLGNSTLSTGNVSSVPFGDVVDYGLGVKKSQYSSVGFLRRISGTSFSSDADFNVVNASSGSSSVLGNSELIIRDSNGDFGGRTADLQSIKIDSNLAIDTATIATGGYVRYYGWGSAGGILIQDSTLAAEKKTAYWNDLHQFKTQNGVSDAPITASSIQVTAITTGSSVTGGTITGNWTLTSGSRMQATYSADLAEWYTSDKKYEPGTVLVFGGDAETTTTNVKMDTRVAGVVSTDPAYTMNAHLAEKETASCVALQGRVPCKVVGKIRKGDILVTSSIPGVAMAASSDVKVGSVVGKALENYDSDHIGKIEIAVGRT